MLLCTLQPCLDVQMEGVIGKTKLVWIISIVIKPLFTQSLQALLAGQFRQQFAQRVSVDFSHILPNQVDL